MILTDNTNRVKVQEKAEMSKWVIEKLDGKAIQKHDVGENMLSVLLDRLDARGTPAQREVSPSAGADIEVRALEAPAEASKDELASWVADFCGESE